MLGEFLKSCNHHSLPSILLLGVFPDCRDKSGATNFGTNISMRMKTWIQISSNQVKTWTWQSGLRILVLGMQRQETPRGPQDSQASWIREFQEETLLQNTRWRTTEEGILTLTSICLHTHVNECTHLQMYTHSHAYKKNHENDNKYTKY